MSELWPDLPGVTRVGDHPRLPRRPAVAAALIEEACLHGGTLPELVERVARRTRAERVRLEGMAGWLPLSRVARWGPDGRLQLHPDTSPYDLALRYGAWVGCQPVEAEVVERLTAYARGVVEPLASSRAPVGGPPFTPEGGPRRTPGAAAPDELTVRLGRLIDQLDAAFLERRTHVRMVLLALVSGQHALLLGPPGTAKSLLARAVAGCFRDATYFEYLLSRFTHPDELFGPVSIPGLKEEDYRRLTQGFLPQAEVAFLDEIFKANSAILNSLLTLINERVFHHGRHRDRVPLVGLVGASNELPDPEGGLGALFDRFLVRLTVPPLGEGAAFLAVATGDVAPPALDPADALTSEDLLTLRRRAEEVEVPPTVRAALLTLWREAASREWAVSDRRWRQAVGLLKVGAAAEGRRALGLLDLLLLEHVLPNDPREAAAVRDVLVDVVAPRAVPEHDLRAQWTLLRLDRVAPPDGAPLGADVPPDHSGRLALRREHVARMHRLVDQAVDELAADRQRVEGGRAGRLWVPEVPARVLAAHVRAGRDLARGLEAVERYADELRDDASVARALLHRLPEPVRRDFGAGVALKLRLVETGDVIGLSLAGERVERPAAEVDVEAEHGSPGRLSRRGASRASFELDAFERAAELPLRAAELIGFLRGELDLEVLVDRVGLSGARHALAVLQRVHKHLGASGVPAPPPWPAPER